MYSAAKSYLPTYWFLIYIYYTSMFQTVKQTMLLEKGNASKYKMQFLKDVFVCYWKLELTWPCVKKQLPLLVKS